MMILVYVTAQDKEEAKAIAKILLEKKLCACVNVIPQIFSFYLWPPEEKKLKEEQEVVLIIKTLEKKYLDIEKEIKKIHSYDNPAIFSIPVSNVSKSFLDWIESEIK